MLQEMSIDWSKVQTRVLDLETDDSFNIDLKDILTAQKLSSLRLSCGDMYFSSTHQVDKEMMEERDMHIYLETTNDSFPSSEDEWLKHLGFRVDPPGLHFWFSAATYDSAKHQNPEMFWD